jgi:polysaccharide export outer membrane protein
MSARRSHADVMRLSFVTAMLSGMLVATQVHGAGADGGAPSRATPEAAGYRLQPGDALIVSVWKEPELQAELLVRPDGGISFPLAGDMAAAGQTVEQLRRVIESRLQRFLPDAVVTVAVRQIGGNFVYVIGKVNRPGQFAFSRTLDVMQALSLAGGATAYADLNDIRILQREDGVQRAVPFHYGEVERGRRLDQNIQLRSGDTVVVP